MSELDPIVGELVTTHDTTAVSNEFFSTSCGGSFQRSQEFDLSDACCNDDLKSKLGIAVVEDEASEIKVDEWNALQHPVYWRCLTWMCNIVASVACHLKEKDNRGGMQTAEDHDIHTLIHDRPNRLLTPFQWKRQMMFHTLHWGNYFARIKRKDGRAIELNPMHPDHVGLGQTEDGRIMYSVQNKKGEWQLVFPDNMFHLSGLSFDGLWGLRPLTFFRPTVANGLGQRAFQSSFFGRGGKPGGILRIPTGLNEEEAKKFVESFEVSTLGVRNVNKILALEEDSEFIPLTYKLRESQVVESMDMNARDVVNLFGLPPSVAAIQDSQSFNSLEISSEEKLAAVDPWLTQFEYQCNLKLLFQGEHKTHRVICKREDLRKVELKTLIETMLKELESGGLTLDEFRNARNRPAFQEDYSEKPRMPANIGYADKLREATDQQGNQQNQQLNEEVTDAMIEVCSTLLTKAANTFCRVAERAAAKDSTIIEYVDGGYEESRDVFLTECDKVDKIFQGVKDRLLNSVCLLLLNELKPLLEQPDNRERIVMLVEFHRSRINRDIDRELKLCRKNY